MHLRLERKSGPQAVIEGMTDPARRRELAEQATDAATRIAADVAKRSGDLGSQVGERMSDVAHAVAEEGHELMHHYAKTQGSKKPRRHRLRNMAVIAGAGALAAYFLDPKNGAERRAAAMRRTNSSAQAVANGLDRAAEVAHHTADATLTDPMGSPAQTVR